MKRNLYFMYAISFFQGMVFYSSIATLYRQVAGLSIFQITLIESISLVLSFVFDFVYQYRFQFYSIIQCTTNDLGALTR